MQIVGCQLDIVWEDKVANHARVRGLLERSTLEPGALVVLPEMFATGFNMQVHEVDEGASRPSERFLAELAGDFDVFVVAGVVHRGADGRGLNQAVVFGPDGSEITRYTKLHPFSFAKEDRYYASGATMVTFSWQGITVAPTICYDLRFPEVFRVGALAGAMLYPVIANWPSAREQHWLSLLQARAIENQAYVIGVNRCGRDPWLPYPGRSLIVDPRGKILADGGREEGLIEAVVDAEALLAYRREFPALNDIRSDLLVRRD
jgi:predicted amidohydrolase